MTKVRGHKFMRVISRISPQNLLLGVVSLSVSTFAFSTSANAQDHSALASKKPATASKSLSSNTSLKTENLIGLSPTLRGALIDLPVDDKSLFNLDFPETGCFSEKFTCMTREGDTPEIGFSAPSYVKLNSKGLDLELTPSATVRFDDENSSAVIGALLRIGGDLRKDSEFDNNTWYFFAGADAETLTYRPDVSSGLTRGNFNLQDRIIVGDAQAGVGYRIGDADLSLSYTRREVSGLGAKNTQDDSSFKEDAATLSFTWRR